ncbi:MAG: hypothetical protein M1135_03520 [Candidatus Omnitrophica bacterium]|jgi:hypothetical protein|nr:hypothetical protein [Candidatus Omnitrophota bacterium]
MIKIHFLSYLPESIIFASFIFFIFIVLISYKWSGISNRKIFWILHLIAGILILSILFKPQITLKIKGKNPFYVLIDTSMSMGITNSSGKTRLQRVQTFIKNHHFIRNIHPVFYQFGKNIEKIPENKISSLKPLQNITSITESLYKISQISDNHCAGVILFTDGQETGNTNSITNIHYPVYIVGAGGEKIPDASITNVISNSPVFSGENLKIKVYGEISGIQQNNIIVQIKNNNKILKEKTIPVKEKFFKANFTIKENNPGKFIYTANVLPIPGETILQNNSLPFLVRVIHQRIKILYVEGTLRWEYKFLKRYMETNTYFQPVFLIRIGKNIYQQTGGKPVSIPKDIFSSKKFLKKFNIIVLGDIDFSSFTNTEIENLKDFVLSGNGLLFLGGENFLNGLQGTKMNNLIPIIITGEQKNILNGNFVPSITPEAISLGLFNKNYIFPGLSRVNNVFQIKQGSIPIITAQGTNPAIIAAINKFFGGETAVVCTDNTWKWNFQGKKSQKAYQYFWTKIFRLLCSPDNILGIGKSLPDIIIGHKIYGIGEKVSVKFILKHLKNSGIKAFVLSPDDKKTFVKIKSNSITFTPYKKGIYLIEVKNKTSKIFKDILVTKYGREFVHPEWNQPYMKNIAQITGGDYYTLKNADVLKTTLKNRKNLRTINLTLSKNTDRWLIFIILVLLGACWFLRRKQNIV